MYTHRRRTVHLDIKPENVILFDGQHVRLTDFGIAKVSQSTLHGSDTGTVGYMAPEQAMGRPSLRSNVFFIGLIVYRKLNGHRPEWPFAGARRLARPRPSGMFLDAHEGDQCAAGAATSRCGSDAVSLPAPENKTLRYIHVRQR